MPDGLERCKAQGEMKRGYGGSERRRRNMRKMRRVKRGKREMSSVEL